MKKIANWLGLLISLGALAWLLTAYDFSEMGPSLRQAGYTFLLPVSALLVVNYLLRAMRWRLLFPAAAPVRMKNVFGALMIGYLFNNLLPARGGEFVKIYVLGKSEEISKSGVLATVVVEKTADLLIAMGLLSLLLLYYPLPDWVRHAGFVVGAVTLAAAGTIVWLRLAGTATVEALVNTLQFLPAGFRQWWNATANRFLDGLSGGVSFARALRFTALSAVIWGLELLIMYFVAQAFNIVIGAAGLLLVMLMILFGTMVPSSPGYIGTYEFFGVSALSLLGVASGPALSFVIVLHGIMLLVPGVIGAICFWLWGMPRPQAGSGAETQ